MKQGGGGSGSGWEESFAGWKGNLYSWVCLCAGCWGYGFWWLGVNSGRREGGGGWGW